MIIDLFLLSFPSTSLCNLCMFLSYKDKRNEDILPKQWIFCYLCEISVQVKQLQNPEVVFETIIGLVVRLAEHGLIHCDFNEFNIMVCGRHLILLSPHLWSCFFYYCWVTFCSMRLFFQYIFDVQFNTFIFVTWRSMHLLNFLTVHPIMITKMLYQIPLSANLWTFFPKLPCFADWWWWEGYHDWFSPDGICITSKCSNVQIFAFSSAA